MVKLQPPRNVAVKVLKESAGVSLNFRSNLVSSVTWNVCSVQSKQDLSNIVREAILMQSCKHPNVIEVVGMVSRSVAFFACSLTFPMAAVFEAYTHNCVS